jgi:uncharacterized protein (DUF58 family)
LNEITITAEMTWQEYDACQNVLLRGKRMWIAIWTLLAIGAASLASSAALTWGTPASFLAGLALVTLAISLYWSAALNASLRRRAYIKYSESNPSYTFTIERILATSRYGQGSFAWAAVDDVTETRTAYLLEVGNRYIFVPKRNIPSHSLDDFIRLLIAHRLLEER